MVMDFDQGALPEPRLVGRQFLFAAAGRGDEAQGFRAWLAPPPSCRRARRPGGFWPEKRSPGAIFPMPAMRSEAHTSELQSLMRISYAVFCLNKTTTKIPIIPPAPKTTTPHLR